LLGSFYGTTNGHLNFIKIWEYTVSPENITIRMASGIPMAKMLLGKNWWTDSMGSNNGKPITHSV